MCDPNTVPERLIAYRQLNGVPANVKVPGGCGDRLRLRPGSRHLARQRRAPGPPRGQARDLPLATVTSLVHAHTDDPQLGFLGEKTVNVLDLNLALDNVWGAERGDSWRRGKLRIYLGAAPGVGKTFAMLDEGWRRPHRGTDVVVGYVETHGRPKTDAQLRDLAVVPRRTIDLPRSACSRRWTSTRSSRARPAVVLVDELAHTNIPGSRNEKRWQDVERAARRRASTSSRPSTSSTSRASTTSWSSITGVDPARDRPRRGGARRRPDRARRHEPRGAAPAHGARQHLPARAGRRRARPLLPRRQPRPRCASSRCCGSPTGSTSELQQYRERHGISRAVGDEGARGRRAHRRAAVANACSGAASRMAARVDGELVGVHVGAADGLARCESDAARANSAACSTSSGAVTPR